jgi:hypothetical protein
MTIHLIAVSLQFLFGRRAIWGMTALRNKDWRNEINGVGAQMWFMCEENMFTDLHINVLNKQHTKVIFVLKEIHKISNDF